MSASRSSSFMCSLMRYNAILPLSRTSLPSFFLWSNRSCFNFLSISQSFGTCDDSWTAASRFSNEPCGPLPESQRSMTSVATCTCNIQSHASRGRLLAVATRSKSCSSQSLYLSALGMLVDLMAFTTSGRMIAAVPVFNVLLTHAAACAGTGAVACTVVRLLHRSTGGSGERRPARD